MAESSQSTSSRKSSRDESSSDEWVVVAKEENEFEFPKYDVEPQTIDTAEEAATDKQEPQADEQALKPNKEIVEVSAKLEENEPNSAAVHSEFFTVSNATERSLTDSLPVDDEHSEMEESGEVTDDCSAFPATHVNYEVPPDLSELDISYTASTVMEQSMNSSISVVSSADYSISCKSVDNKPKKRRSVSVEEESDSEKEEIIAEEAASHNIIDDPTRIENDWIKEKKFFPIVLTLFVVVVLYCRCGSLDGNLRKCETNLNGRIMELKDCRAKDVCDKTEKLHFEIACAKHLGQINSQTSDQFEQKQLLDEIRTLRDNLTQALRTYADIFAEKRIETGRLRRDNWFLRNRLRSASKAGKIERALRKSVVDLENDVASLRIELKETQDERKRLENSYDACRSRLDVGAIIDGLSNSTFNAWKMFNKFIDDVQVKVKKESTEKKNQEKIDRIFEKIGDAWTRVKSNVPANLFECESRFGDFCRYFSPFGQKNAADVVQKDVVEVHATEEDADAHVLLPDADSQVLMPPPTARNLFSSENAAKDKFDLERLAKEVKKFRAAVKSTSFRRQIGEKASGGYLALLKRLFKNAAMVGEDSRFWMCQKLWWMQRDGLMRLCSAHLELWQRNEAAGWLKPFLRAWTDLAVVIDELDGREIYEDDVANADWLFERWLNREEVRRAEQRGFEESKWVFRRGAERDDWRRQKFDEWHRYDDDDDVEVDDVL